METNIKQVTYTDLSDGFHVAVEFGTGKDVVTKTYFFQPKHLTARADVDAIIAADAASLDDFKAIVDSLVADAEVKDTTPVALAEAEPADEVVKP